LAQRFLADRFPGRFVLGLGVSHPLIVERVLGQTFEHPLATMRGYLDDLDATRGGSAETTPAPRVLASLRPRMLSLAAERAAGALDAVGRRVEEHLVAGGDHVCVGVLTRDDTTVPVEAWRRLAPALMAV